MNPSSREIELPKSPMTLNKEEQQRKMQLLYQASPIPKVIVEAMEAELRKKESQGLFVSKTSGNQASPFKTNEAPSPFRSSFPFQQRLQQQQQQQQQQLTQSPIFMKNSPFEGIGGLSKMQPNQDGTDARNNNNNIFPHSFQIQSPVEGQCEEEILLTPRKAPKVPPILTPPVRVLSFHQTIGTPFKNSLPSTPTSLFPPSALQTPISPNTPFKPSLSMLSTPLITSPKPFVSPINAPIKPINFDQNVVLEEESNKIEENTPTKQSPNSITPLKSPLNTPIKSTTLKSTPTKVQSSKDILPNEVAPNELLKSTTSVIEPKEVTPLNSTTPSKTSPTTPITTPTKASAIVDSDHFDSIELDAGDVLEVEIHSNEDQAETPRNNRRSPRTPTKLQTAREEKESEKEINNTPTTKKQSSSRSSRATSSPNNKKLNEENQKENERVDEEIIKTPATKKQTSPRASKTKNKPVVEEIESVHEENEEEEEEEEKEEEEALKTPVTKKRSTARVSRAQASPSKNLEEKEIENEEENSHIIKLPLKTKQTPPRASKAKPSQINEKKIQQQNEQDEIEIDQEEIDITVPTKNQLSARPSRAKASPKNSKKQEEEKELAKTPVTKKQSTPRVSKTKNLTVDDDDDEEEEGKEEIEKTTPVTKTTPRSSRAKPIPITIEDDKEDDTSAQKKAPINTKKRILNVEPPPEILGPRVIKKPSNFWCTLQHNIISSTFDSPPPKTNKRATSKSLTEKPTPPIKKETKSKAISPIPKVTAKASKKSNSPTPKITTKNTKASPIPKVIKPSPKTASKNTKKPPTKESSKSKKDNKAQKESEEEEEDSEDVVIITSSTSNNSSTKSSKSASVKPESPTRKRSARSKEDADGWTEEQIAMLNKAWNSVPPNAARRWSKIASFVEGKTSQECAAKWDSKNEEHIKGEQKKLEKKLNLKKTKELSPLKLGDNFKTAKNKQKLKQAIEKSNQGHVDDYFQSPRVSKTIKKVNVEEESDEDKNLKTPLKKLLNAKELLESESSSNDDEDEYEMLNPKANPGDYYKYQTRYKRPASNNLKRKRNDTEDKKEIKKKKLGTFISDRDKSILSKTLKKAEKKHLKNEEKEDMEADGQSICSSRSESEEEEEEEDEISQTF